MALARLVKDLVVPRTNQAHIYICPYIPNSNAHYLIYTLPLMYIKYYILLELLISAGRGTSRHGGKCYLTAQTLFLSWPSRAGQLLEIALFVRLFIRLFVCAIVLKTNLDSTYQAEILHTPQSYDSN